MPDFRDFLKPKEPIVLPYFGGTRVHSVDRQFRVEGEHAPGWWRFQIDGRKAVPKEQAEPVDLGALPAIRGHWVDGMIVESGRALHRIPLLPSEEPAPLARVVGRRWYSGEVLLDSIEFEDDAELAARSALERRGSIANVPNVVPSLRTAFAYALGMATARDMRVPVTLRELAPAVIAIGEHGIDAARARITALAEQREEAVRAAEARRIANEALDRQRRHDERIRSTAAQARSRQVRGTPAERADAALEAAGARMLSSRRIGQELEVIFTYMDERFIATVDPNSLHVFDSGICLAGADEELTLDSLPSVIKEAIEEDRLNITRRS